MKSKSASHSVLIGLFVVLAFAVYSSPARADSTTWIGEGTDWFDARNWDNGVPTAATDAFINNGSKVGINRPGATARSLTLGANAGQSGEVSVDGTTGGNLVIPPGDASRTTRKQGRFTSAMQAQALWRLSKGGWFPADLDIFPEVGRVRP